MVAWTLSYVPYLLLGNSDPYFHQYFSYLYTLVAMYTGFE
jgi:hypothetical protein